MKTAKCGHVGSIEDTYNYIIKNKGIDTEDGYSNEAPMGECHFNSSNIGATMTTFKNIKSKDENALQKAVATIGPIAVAIDASHRSFQLYTSGGRDFLSSIFIFHYKIT